ncbi:uncharacterized protein BP5553_01343 [Venustampulla echinocandica]|uniref:CSI2 protein n=1 Tax=Venustampulla echinocandica TaxID=2656787 RepID=A0A370U0R4_9HELO|nr:uncharacterized protein BP5553_01343 [Venustampulla echinocandica]RDL41364.1 hypothetical protein BP5553_01343 [Venustampulla echinocandica]
MRFLRSPLLAAVAVSLLAMTASAADTPLPNLSTDVDTKADPTPTNKAPSTNKAPETSKDATDKAETTKAPDTKKASNTAAPKTDEKTTATTDKPTTAVITGSETQATDTKPIPTITGDETTGTDGGPLPTNMPKLEGAFTIVPASVPPTHDAPYMQASTLPEGTVFIAVGAILGFMAMSVLLWRGLVAWSLHRSVKRAAQQQNMSDTKALFSTPAAPFYKDYHDRESTISLSGLGHRPRKGNRPPTSNGPAPTSSLFFSPTAGAAAAGGLANQGNRGSAYLPAGYYAAGAASPGNAQSHVSIGQGPAISMSNLGPGAPGYARRSMVNPSPPDSPSLLGNRGNMASSSTLNLTSGYGGDQRAPSAVLDDLFDAEGAPPVPGHQRVPSGGHHRY